MKKTKMSLYIYGLAKKFLTKKNDVLLIEKALLLKHMCHIGYYCQRNCFQNEVNEMLCQFIRKIG